MRQRVKDRLKDARDPYEKVFGADSRRFERSPP